MYYIELLLHIDEPYNSMHKKKNLLDFKRRGQANLWLFALQGANEGFGGCIVVIQETTGHFFMP